MPRGVIMCAFVGRTQAIEQRILHDSVWIMAVGALCMSIQRIAAPQCRPAFNKISIDDIVRLCARLLIDRRDWHAHSQVEIRRDVLYLTRWVANHRKSAMTLVTGFFNSGITPGFW